MLRTTVLLLAFVAFPLSGCDEVDDTDPSGNNGADADADSDSDSDTDGDSDGDADGDSDSDTDGDGDPADCSGENCTGDLNPPTGYDFIEIQDFITEDGELEIRYARQTGEGDTVGETFAFYLIRFSLCSANKNICVKNDGNLSYEWGHHNWNDTMEATHGDTKYIVHTFYDISTMTPEWKDTIEAKSASTGDTLWGPLALVDDGCQTLPPGNPNACMHRERTDN